MKRIRFTTRGVAILFIVWSVTMAIGAAVAQEVIQVPIDTVVHGKPGQVKLIDPPGVVSVPADKVGRQCSVHETSENNTSVHPNNDLIVTSGGESVTLFDVESGSGVRVDGDGLLTLGETVKIEVRLGADGVFSGGFIVGLCETEAPPPPPPPPPPACSNPALSIVVAPADQEVVVDGDASFDVTVTNTGDEPFFSVDVDSSIAACDSALGAMALGAQSSYTCTAEGVGADLAATFAAAGTGQDPTCVASANAGANVRVQESPPPPPPSEPPPPPSEPPPPPPAPTTPRTPSITTTATTTTTPPTPTGVPTGTGDGGSSSVPVGALAVVGLGLAAIGVGTYRVTRREH